MQPITSILVIKHQRKMFLLSDNQPIKTYDIALGKDPSGAKQFEGDYKTPEGVYTIYHKSTQSEFYKSIGISYPNEKEKKFAQEMGKHPGGQIRIHGFKNDFMGDQTGGKKVDWTAGCIAVTNAEMDEIFDLVETGIPITIEP